MLRSSQIVLIFFQNFCFLNSFLDFFHVKTPKWSKLIFGSWGRTMSHNIEVICLDAMTHGTASRGRSTDGVGSLLPSENPWRPPPPPHPPNHHHPKKLPWEQGMKLRCKGWRWLGCKMGLASEANLVPRGLGPRLISLVKSPLLSPNRPTGQPDPFFPLSSSYNIPSKKKYLPITMSLWLTYDADPRTLRWVWVIKGSKR